ncbi:MAG: uroporphyrinogen decarboxylase family protein [Pseudoflavonifractor sp.]|nr:uroporphyrinogen decarboxylase family protein [Pseudoflavonifractor sp.]
MNMNKWTQDMICADVKKPMPVLSFPSIQLMNIIGEDLISNSATQAKGMGLVAERTDAAASVSMMDLSVEAEAFGSAIRVSMDEVPTVTGRIVTSQEDAKALTVPDVLAGRTGLYIEAIRQAKRQITDRPVLAGIIGPFSLAGRLLDVSEAMISCYEDPDMVHEVLDKVTQFITAYALAYRDAGADGVVMAEPLAGILSPGLIEEFSTKYVKRVVGATKADSFAFIYHNCGNNVPILVDSIKTIGANGYHFGNAIDLKQVLELMPDDVLVMGNVDPASQFRNGTPASIREATLSLMEKCTVHKNFVVSSGCDIPPLSSWENIHAFFAAVKEFYNRV